jgi:competence protein ComEA
MNTWKSVLLGIVLGLFISGAILLIAMPPRGQPLVLSPPPTVPPTIVIYITGAVNHPGVYTIGRLSRVNDAVQVAGGLLASADPNSINLAAKIEDGAEIVVLSITETDNNNGGSNGTKQGLTPSPHGTPTVSYPININSAPQALLEEIPGIGPSKAAAIITYRQEHGPFKKVDDIMNVPGIGTGLFATMKNLITVDLFP